MTYTIRGTDSEGVTHTPDGIYPSPAAARAAAKLYYESFGKGDIIMEYVEILNSRGAVFDIYSIANIFAGGGYPKKHSNDYTATRSDFEL